ncbi:MAG: cytochrome c peroxidase [Campylobacterota bacterium]|nr:cytochrome c peroxidase [Campylobacterota bacterium]
MKIILYFMLLIGVLLAKEPISPLEAVPYDEAKAKLGKELFSDTILSEDNTVSCASCHLLNSGGDNDIPFSFGIKGQMGDMNTPTVFNAALNFKQFWNGRAKNLKEQAHQVIENPKEMGSNIYDIVKRLRLNPNYSEKFEKIYHEKVSKDNLIDAIVEFERSLITLDAPFDLYLKGESNAIAQQAKDGYALFKSKGCILCHNGRNVGGNLFNRFGIHNDHHNSKSLGRYEVTKKEEDKFVFKVPSLRNVELTAPYMHDGRAKTLHEAVKIMSQYQLGRSISKHDIDAIVAFLKSLTGKLPHTLK